MSTGPAFRPSRRRLLLGSVAVAGLCYLSHGRAAVAASDLERFMALSRSLTGRTDLDPQTGEVYLTALAGTPDTSAALQRLLAARGDAAPEEARATLETEILGQWYSGIYRDGASEKVATYDDALMWQAMGFTGPPGRCHGPIGFWSEAPKS